MVTQSVQTPEDSIAAFERRMQTLTQELHLINKELGQVDLLALAHRTEDLVRQTKGLLDANVNILFHNEPLTFELWEVFFHRIIEADFAFVHEHHEGGGGDRLGL